MTPAQLATLKTDIAANANTIPAGKPWSGSFAGQAINTLPNTTDANIAIAGWYSFPVSPDWWVWYVVPAANVFDAVTWKNFTPSDIVPATDAGSQYLNRVLVCQSKQINIQTLLLGKESIDGRKSKIRTGFKDSLENIPSGVSGALLDAGWTDARNAMSRLALNVEKLFATGAGTKAGAGDMTFEGSITESEVQAARNLP